jgi:hypothetical protein
MPDNNTDKNKQAGLSWSTPTPSSTPGVTPKPTPAPVKPAIPTQSNTSHAARYVGLVVGGVIIGVVITWAWTASRTPSQLAANNTVGGAATTTTENGKPAMEIPGLGGTPTLTITSPQKAGRSVMVAKAVVTAPTWVVVYDNKDGKPGNALGARLFFPQGQTGTIELLRTTIAGKSYLVGQQVDNGDKKFSLRGDALLTEGGEVKWVTFEAN